jgi:hypothetical protein
MARGYNVMPSGGSYTDAMLALHDAETMHLADVQTDLLRH